MNDIDIKDKLALAVIASIKAGEAILRVYDSPDFGIEVKEDRSPLTKADKESNRVIESYLKGTGIPIISEETKMLDFSIRKNWEMCWMVDPLDGTKEFIKRNGEFTVNIALIEKGIPILGVIYVPVTRELYYANTPEQRAYKQTLEEAYKLEGMFSEENQILLDNNKSSGIIRVVGSRSHMNDGTQKYISDLKKEYKEVEIVSKGSSLKFCLVAEGRADVYPRLAPTMEWDTAAGHAICNAVGLKVNRWGTQGELEYNKEDLLNPHFLVH